jgi:hypothetical protein
MISGVLSFDLEYSRHLLGLFHGFISPDNHACNALICCNC